MSCVKVSADLPSFSCENQCIVRSQKRFLSKFTVTPISTVPSVRYVPRYAVSAVKLRQDLEGA